MIYNSLSEMFNAESSKTTGYANYVQTENEFVAMFFLAGFKKEEIIAFVSSGVIRVVAQMSDKNKYYGTMLPRQTFMCYVPKEFANSQFEAEFSDGVLTIKAQNRVKKSEVVQLEIK